MDDLLVGTFRGRLKLASPDSRERIVRWAGEEPAVESCTIITTDANEVVRPLHDLMPVILGPGDYARWLDPASADPGVLQEMLRPYAPEPMTAVAVSTFVNNAQNEGADCLRAV